MSTCDPNSPSVSFTGTLDRCTRRASCKYPVSFTLRNANGFSCHNETIQAGASSTITPSPAPANMVHIDTPQPVEVRFNGGADWLRVDRLFLATMTVTEMEIRNQIGSPPSDVAVEVYFAQGDVL